MRRRMMVVVAAVLVSGLWSGVSAGAPVGSLADPEGSIAAWGSNIEGQTDVPAPNEGFTAVAGGRYHSLGLRADGSIVTWGLNNHGQTDVPDPNEGFTAVAGRGYHSLGLRADGSIAAWGWNYWGQTVVPDPNEDFTAVAGGGWHSLGLKADGSIAAWGKDGEGQTDVPDPNEGFTAVAGGWAHSIGLRADGSIAAWGDNQYDQLDVPAGVYVAMAAGNHHGLALHARTDYEDLLVDGAGITDVASHFNRDITVSGDAEIRSRMWAWNNPKMTVGDTITVTDTGEIIGQASFQADEFVADGTLTGTGEGIAVQGDVTGSFTSTGTLAIDGTLSPGSSPGLVTAETLDLSQADLLMEIGGTDPSDYDRIIADELIAGGELDVALWGGFTPQPGDTFHLFEVGTWTGEFSEIHLPDAYWDDSFLYQTGEISFSGEVDPLPIPIPEPAGLSLLGLALLGLKRRKRR